MCFLVEMDMVVSKHMSSGLHTKKSCPQKKCIVVHETGQLGESSVVDTHLSTKSIQ